VEDCNLGVKAMLSATQDLIQDITKELDQLTVDLGEVKPPPAAASPPDTSWSELACQLRERLHAKFTSLVSGLLGIHAQ
jgi:hypothetical protein